MLSAILKWFWCMVGVMGGSEPPTPAPEPRIIQSRLKTVRKLGSGGYGDVVLMVDSRNCSKQYAVKLITVGCWRWSEVFKEFRIHRFLSEEFHEHIIALFAVYHSADQYEMIMEFASGGDLFEHVKRNSQLDSETSRRFFQHLMAGIKFIHEHNLAHRDIKHENLLITANNVLKISDFGKATEYRDSGKEIWFFEKVGSLRYVAPELLSFQMYRGPPVDIWAAGVVLFGMITDLLCSILEVDPTKRATIDDIEADLWMHS
ncbi:hypothetical protein GCK72_025442 [Caenorhabditis remanei]|uniref:Protein kinase domain-containing protein n=1 Tax=Caenorhabditis remanei TaxID=31234 RepID=A0A6A5G2Q2_CAERE|nr:hypothetical protein GCK72_025442 [Caenorhabditis remanei]KAF1748975.1 hypothetical protein GCK72_025442 [Caenorhabditis remanei]